MYCISNKFYCYVEVYRSCCAMSYRCVPCTMIWKRNHLHVCSCHMIIRCYVESNLLWIRSVKTIAVTRMLLDKKEVVICPNDLDTTETLPFLVHFNVNRITFDCNDSVGKGHSVCIAKEDVTSWNCKNNGILCIFAEFLSTQKNQQPVRHATQNLSNVTICAYNIDRVVHVVIQYCWRQVHNVIMEH